MVEERKDLKCPISGAWIKFKELYWIKISSTFEKCSNWFGDHIQSSACQESVTLHGCGYVHGFAIAKPTHSTILMETARLVQ